MPDRPQIGDTRDVLDPGDLAAATDATLDAAEMLLDGVDLTYVDPRVQQAVALITAAGVTVDQLMDVMGVADPDDVDDEPSEPGSVDMGEDDPALMAGGPASLQSALTGMGRAREDLTRTFEFRTASDTGDGLTLEGIAATFNDWTTIADHGGDFREMLAPSVFNKTLREKTPVLMFNHGSHPMVGEMPIGSFEEIKPRATGLYVRARLSDNWLVQPVRDSIANGSVSGMSFRFSVVKDDWKVADDGVAERTLREVKLPELGPVVFPAYEKTSVSVRSREILTSLEDPETRAELARALLIGTPLGAATAEPRKHSTRTKTQRRALALLANI